MTRPGRVRRLLAGVVGFAWVALLLSGCGASGVSISSVPSPVPCSEAGADTSSSQLRSELGSSWRYRAFLVSQLTSQGASGAGASGAGASGPAAAVATSAASEALMTNSAEIASAIGRGFGETQANIAESQLVKNADLMAAYFRELSGAAHPSSAQGRSRAGAELAQEELEAGIAELSDFLWLLTSAPRMVLRGLLAEQVRLVAEGQLERAIGLGTEVGDLLALAFHRRLPEKYPASPETPSATARSRREAGLDQAIYVAFRTGAVEDLRAGLAPGAYQAAVSAIQAKDVGDFGLAYTLLDSATDQVRSAWEPPAACDEGTR